MLILVPIFALASQTASFSVQHEFPVPGNGGWDYITVDPDANRLYISRSTHVQVMATDTGKIVADIPNTPGVHGIALDQKIGKGFISNGRDNSVSIFDLKTDKETARVKVGQGPDGIMYDAISDTVFTFNGRSSDATAISAKTGEVRGTVSLGGKPEGSVTDGKGNVFVNLEDKSEVVEFNAWTLKILKRWPIAPGEDPSGISYDAEKGLVFSACGNKILTILDAKTGKVLGTAPTGDGSDYASYDPSSGTVFTSNGEGTLSVIRSINGKFTNIQNVKTMASARTMALDAKHHIIYLMAAEFEATQPGQHRGKMKPESARIIVVR